MSECKYRGICGRDVEDDSAEGLCILHSRDPAKDKNNFIHALIMHRNVKGDDFSYFVFPEVLTLFKNLSLQEALSNNIAFTQKTIGIYGAFIRDMNFTGATFCHKVSFSNITFNGNAKLSRAVFRDAADFSGTTFTHDADFSGTIFNQNADFRHAQFKQRARFHNATFEHEALFPEAIFDHGVSFSKSTFCQGGNFQRTAFIGTTLEESVDFSEATFLGRTVFSHKGNLFDIPTHIFAGVDVNFRQVVIQPLDAITFIGADLRKCLFLDTDVRKIQMTDVVWLRRRGRAIVYDEQRWREALIPRWRPWQQLERLYRELKQNYEDRRDYERAGDFHYGEKEMRRRNRDTARGLRFFLWLYWVFSGYGERFRRPLIWAALLFVGSTIGYMWGGLHPKGGGAPLAWGNIRDWLKAADYSIRVMTLLKPDDWIPHAQFVNTVQSLLGPTLLGLFALALRQRLKR